MSTILQDGQTAGQVWPYDLEADLLAATAPEGQEATAADTGLAYKWILGGWRRKGAAKYTGQGAPSSGLGNNGDEYTDTANRVVYVKSAGAWAVVSPLGDAYGFVAEYTYDSTDANANPGAGFFRLVRGGGNQNAATDFAFHSTDAQGIAGTLVHAKSATYTFIRITKKSDATVYLTFRAKGTITETGWVHWSVDNMESSATNPFTNGDALRVVALRIGGILDTSAAFSGDWAISTTTKVLSRYQAGVLSSVVRLTSEPTRTVILNGTTSYTTPTGAAAIDVEAVGGGGGGGGCTQGNRAGAGGGSGGYGKKMIASPSASYTVAVGAKGSAGAAGANNGGNGGDTTFASPAVLTAKGGTGGGGSNGGGIAGGAGGVVGSGGDINAAGTSGGPSFVATSGVGGFGGTSHFGGAAAAVLASAKGNDAAAYGAGGGGGADSNSAARGGGTGSDGVLVVTEFI